MSVKKYIGQVISIRFKYTNEEVIYTGYVVDYNDNWTLLKYNSFEYMLDGFVILNNKYTIEFKRGDSERFTQKIFDKKGHGVIDSDKIPIDDIKIFLEYLTKRYGVFQFNMRTSLSCWLGKVKKIEKNKLTIDYLNPRAIWTKTMDFQLGNIRTVEFDTDYINSLMLVRKKKK